MNRRGTIVQRRLAAIFCADVAGYTRLMHADESGTLRLLSAHREITDQLITRHGGRIANTAGDSILVEFASAVDAVRCALEIQERLASANDALPEERRVSFRIGLHVGEAMVRDGDLFGDGVNIAARLQSLAFPGAVCLSAIAYEFVHKHVALAYEDLGPQAVKNLEAPVRVYLVRPSGRPVAGGVPSVHRRIEFNLARRFHRILHAAGKELTELEGLMSEDMAVLASLRDAPGVDARRLAERVGIDLPIVRRIVARDEQRGLIERSEGGGRRGSEALRLTSRGLELYLRLHPLFAAAADRIMAPLSEHERETLQTLLVRVIDASEREAIQDRLERHPYAPPQSDAPASPPRGRGPAA